MSIEHIEVNGHELTAFDLPPEPSETYEVHVDGLGEIVIEKGKPPKEKDVPAMYMRKLVPELCEQNAELHRENSKLRELVRDMMIAWWACDNDKCPRHDERCEKGRFCAFDECARDLGIEVSE